MAVLHALLGVVVLATAARAATIGVTVANDELNGDADCSLREAVNAANDDTAVSGCPAGSGPDTIMLPEGTYLLTRVGAEDAAQSGALDVTDDLVLAGAGTATTVIDANAAVTGDRALHVLGGAELTVSGVTIRGGDPAGDGGACSTPAPS